MNDRDKPWLKLDAITGTIVGIFSWSPTYGQWLSNHWLYAGQTPPLNERRMFVGTLTDLETYENGEGGTVSATTGPFWALDSAFNGMMPYGAFAGSMTTTPIITPLVTSVFDTTGAATDPEAIGVYFIKPSGRIFDRGA